MTPGFIALVLSTVAWVVMLWFYLLPLLSMPIARVKREFSMTLIGMGSLVISVEWLTRKDMQLESIIALCAFIVFACIMVVLLRRLDYYVEEVLQELFILAMMSSTIGLLSSVWSWGIESALPLLALRVISGVIPLIMFIVSWLIAKQHYSLWGMALFIGLIIVKWLIFPYWGIWSVIVVLMYSTLVGYVANWMQSTTYAEKIFAWNIAPAKVWSVLVLTAGLLVLFF